jgi:hypothetical protein
MTAADVLQELEAYGDERTKQTLLKHGAKEPFFGVKVADLKKILKKTKKNHALSLELYQSGNSDAMYLAGLMADEKQITRAQLQEWADQAYWYYLSEYTVPWVAAETDFGFELGLEWIESEEERIASAGWSTLAYYASVNPGRGTGPGDLFPTPGPGGAGSPSSSEPSSLYHEWLCHRHRHPHQSPHRKGGGRLRKNRQSGGLYGQNRLQSTPGHRIPAQSDRQRTGREKTQNGTVLIVASAVATKPGQCPKNLAKRLLIEYLPEEVFLRHRRGGQ